MKTLKTGKRTLTRQAVHDEIFCNTTTEISPCELSYYNKFSQWAYKKSFGWTREIFVHDNCAFWEEWLKDKPDAQKWLVKKGFAEWEARLCNNCWNNPVNNSLSIDYCYDIMGVGKCFGYEYWRPIGEGEPPKLKFRPVELRLETEREVSLLNSMILSYGTIDYSEERTALIERLDKAIEERK